MNTLFQSLPEEVQKWLSSEKEAFLKKNIIKNHELNEDQAQKLSLLIIELCGARLEPFQLAEKIERGLELDAETSSKIALDLRDNILSPIQKQLAKKGIDIQMIHQGQIGPNTQHKQEESAQPVPEFASLQEVVQATSMHKPNEEKISEKEKQEKDLKKYISKIGPPPPESAQDKDSPFMLFEGENKTRKPILEIRKPYIKEIVPEKKEKKVPKATIELPED